MSLKDAWTRAGLLFSLSVFVLGGFLFDISTPAASEPRLDRHNSGFNDFVRRVQNGDGTMLRGVYVEDVLALPVAQQPDGEANYVSPREGEVTQFSTASHFGTIGILAHNNLSGRSFSRLEIGQEVWLVYGDGQIEYFVVADVLRFQALEPTNPRSDFREADGREILSAWEMFHRVYTGGDRVTFQTCIAANGDLSWGRLFIVATPLRMQAESPEPLTRRVWTITNL